MMGQRRRRDHFCNLIFLLALLGTAAVTVAAHAEIKIVAFGDSKIREKGVPEWDA
jgi:hypothetical protein